MREARRSLASRRQTRRKFIEAVNAGNFFDQINFAFDFRAPGRLGAFPGGEERAFRTTVLVDSNGSETEGAEARLDLLVRNVRAHHAKDFGAGHADLFRGALAGITIDDAGEQLATG